METFTLWIMVLGKLTPIKFDLCEPVSLSRRVRGPGEADMYSVAGYLPPTVRKQISKHCTGQPAVVTLVSKLGVAWTMGGFVLFVILERG